MCRLTLTLLAFLAPALALAEDWHGIWSADPDWCVNAAEIGSVTPAPILLTDTEFMGYENTCDIIYAEALEEPGRYELLFSCMAEGEEYEETRLIEVSGDTLVMDIDTDDPVTFTRCPR